MTARGGFFRGGGKDPADGVCVSCGRKAGVLYRSCPFCGEQVWHPPWRRALSLYVVLLPLLLAAVAAGDRNGVVAMAGAFAAAQWPVRLLAALAAGVLLLPYDNRRLIHAAPGSRFLWLLNGMAACAVILVCALSLALFTRFSGCSPVIRVAAAGLALTGCAVPLVMSCSGWRLIPACALSVTLWLL